LRVLIIEDEERIHALIRRGLEAEGLTVDAALDGAGGLHRLERTAYDAVVLDLGLPDVDGLDLLARFRRRPERTPVLVLTARDGLEDRVRGLDSGADDYLVKPLAMAELVARLRALVRRSEPEAAVTRLVFADLIVDFRTRRATRGPRKMDLSPREYSLLEYMIRHQGEPVTRAMIAESVWDQRFEHFSNVIDVYMGYLRKKVDAVGETKLIHTVRGVGYMLGESATSS